MNMNSYNLLINQRRKTKNETRTIQTTTSTGRTFHNIVCSGWSQTKALGFLSREVNKTYVLPPPFPSNSLHSPQNLIKDNMLMM